MDCWWGRVSSTTAAKRCGCRVSQDINWKSRSDLLLPLQWNHFLHFQPVLESHCLIIATAPKITELKKIQGIVDAILLLPMYCLFLTVLIINFHTYSYRSYAHTISPCWYKLFKTCNTILMSSYLDQVQ